VKRALVWNLSLGYVALAVLANWLASRFIVHVPLTAYGAPAGVFCVGLILVLRDWLQQLAGLAWTLLLVPVGGLSSYLIGMLGGWGSLQRIALASLAAFLASETLEALVFTPIRRRSLTLGVALSATAGNALDSWLFLWLAFSSEAFFAGNFVGKLEMIAVGVALTAARRVVLPVARAA
jgi:queuosine precursor transporter